jgi:crotonobetainyl-CoA:carnitine CoA-transferase CaiB-like acyl-CoA transferase
VKGVFACRDGNYVAISAGNDATVERLFAAIDDSRLRDERFEFLRGTTRAPGRGQRHPCRVACHARDRAEVMECLAGNGVTVAPLYDVNDAADDPHFRAREAILDLPDP